LKLKADRTLKNAKQGFILPTPLKKAKNYEYMPQHFLMSKRY